MTRIRYYLETETPLVVVIPVHDEILYVVRVQTPILLLEWAYHLHLSGLFHLNLPCTAFIELRPPPLASLHR